LNLGVIHITSQINGRTVTELGTSYFQGLLGFVVNILSMVGRAISQPKTGVNLLRNDEYIEKVGK